MGLIEKVRQLCELNIKEHKEKGAHYRELDCDANWFVEQGKIEAYEELLVTLSGSEKEIHQFLDRILKIKKGK